MGHMSQTLGSLHDWTIRTHGSLSGFFGLKLSSGLRNVSMSDVEHTKPVAFMQMNLD